MARDIVFLGALAEREGLPAQLVKGVRESNLAHREWAWRTLEARFSDSGLAGRRIAVWGLTYKPGTNTLRRSSALLLCSRLADAGAAVFAYDPAIDALPSEQTSVTLADDPLAAVEGADALVISTPWPQFRELDLDAALATMDGGLIIDAGGHLADDLAGRGDGTLTYLRVGVGSV